MKIANIVSSSKISVSDEFNVVAAMDDIIHGLPTLIVGYAYVDKNYPNFDISNITLGPDLYWTFKKTEKRDKFQEDLSWFISKVYGDLVNKINYIFVDPIQYRTQSLKKIIKKIRSIKYIITYVHNEMIYVYGDDYIFGIDLKLLDYMGINGVKVKDKIKKISSVFLDDNTIFIGYRNNIARLGNQVRYLPFLYSIRNGQNDSSSNIYISRKAGMVS